MDDDHGVNRIAVVFHLAFSYLTRKLPQIVMCILKFSSYLKAWVEMQLDADKRNERKMSTDFFLKLQPNNLNTLRYTNEYFHHLGFATFF